MLRICFPKPISTPVLPQLFERPALLQFFAKKLACGLEGRDHCRQYTKSGFGLNEGHENDYSSHSHTDRSFSDMTIVPCVEVSSTLA